MDVDSGLSRKDFLKLGAVAGGALVLPLGLVTRPAFGATELVAADYANANRFTVPLPRPRRVDLTRGGIIDVEIVQFEQQVLSGKPKTTLWGYQLPGGGPSWPAASMVMKKDRPVRVVWRNRLPLGGGSLEEAHLLPVDDTVHTAMLRRSLIKGYLPVVTHLHGAHVEAASDGHPEAWFTQGFLQRGPGWKKLAYLYDNSQEAGTLWYHDHTIGITRLNVYSGLAGLCLLRDDAELRLISRGVLPAEEHELELAIQDRWFNDDGTLLFKTGLTPGVDNSHQPSIFPDFICVNGVPWPYLEVEPRKYRFRLLNGCDSRFLILRVRDDTSGTYVPLLRIGTDLGLSDQAVQVPGERLLAGPGERYDLVVDFSSFQPGRTLTVENAGWQGAFRGFKDGSGAVTHNPLDIPFGFGPPVNPINPATTGRVMQFKVVAPVSRRRNATVQAGTSLRQAPIPVLHTSTTPRRQVVLLTGADQYGRIMELQGTLGKHEAGAPAGTFAFFEPVTENPQLNATEIWEIYNYTVPQVPPFGFGLVHPIHLHLVHLKVLERQRFTVAGNAAGVGVKDHVTHDGGVIPGGGRYLDPANVTLGATRQPEPYEQGWKDTVVCYPGEITRIVMKFDRPGNYVWHCHLLHHEDHEMMRPLVVGPVGSTTMSAVAAAPNVLCDLDGGIV